ncbi:hypothetical protein [Streptantibioticus parmotrematis]|uniref:hypothetical protein n=1 Tax=Streptantibioticus parmotrematis TaxID=2873249 RepID=UPI0027E191CB|nr:hypothetical protein [Streptantibioticus parmotrematis]
MTGRAAFQLGEGHSLASNEGWVPVGRTTGTLVEGTQARKLCRTRLDPVPGYDLGYLVGATCADGTVRGNYVSLVVNDRGFAARFAECLTSSTGLPASLEPVSRPSGYLGRDVPGFRVRVVSSYLADLLRQYVGGDAHHLRQRFPRVVLRDQDTLTGFLDGYIDGDGCRSKQWRGRVVVSANVPFLAELATVIGARFTPRTNERSSHLCVSDRWTERGSFHPEPHPLHLVESEWTRVTQVRPVVAEGRKPYTLYAFTLAPHESFLVNGHLVGTA